MGGSECPERERLLAKYKVAASDYRRAMMLLVECADTMSKDDYIRIRNYSEIAHRIEEHARKVLDRHSAKHKCNTATKP